MVKRFVPPDPSPFHSNSNCPLRGASWNWKLEWGLRLEIRSWNPMLESRASRSITAVCIDGVWTRLEYWNPKLESSLNRYSAAIGSSRWPWNASQWIREFLSERACSAVTRAPEVGGHRHHVHPRNAPGSLLAATWRPRRLLPPGLRGVRHGVLRWSASGDLLPRRLPPAGVPAPTEATPCDVTERKRRPAWIGVLMKDVAVDQAAVNRPRATFLNRAPPEAPLAAISLVIAA